MSDKVKITMYASEYCSYCMAARMLLKKKGVDYDEVLVTDDPALREEMERRSNRTSVPQIFIADQAIGGFDELYELEESGELDRILNQQQDITSN
ncbi:MAG: glutaredoxin 3 [Gammaproteobacteria bacterium]|nr:MAG: glutaredoxin 3 [Gammaproteobacteria bacterium]RLA33908.1 MAG: glutaredoxin 3 [Gammaproteobacteria bacterium]